MRTLQRKGTCGTKTCTLNTCPNTLTNDQDHCNIFEYVEGQDIDKKTYTVHSYKRLICDPGGQKGYFLPIFGEDENSSSRGFRIVIYMIGLGWFFIGVAIVSDIFMGSIEEITSEYKFVQVDGEEVRVRMWNDTVANLTLMALGSSAPEIMLSVLEIYGLKWTSGELGPSTIVGSAAFNMLVISGLCVVALGDDTRRISQIGVFGITAMFSVFAYLWLIIILQGFSPNIVTNVEALLTLLFFPLLVTFAYIKDTGKFDCSPIGNKLSKVIPGKFQFGRARQIESTNENFAKTLQPGVLAEILKKIREEDPTIQSDKLHHKAAMNALSRTKRSRAYYRVQATRSLTAGAKIGITANHLSRTIGKLNMSLMSEKGANGALKFGSTSKRESKVDREESQFSDDEELITLTKKKTSVFEDDKIVSIKVARYGTCKGSVTIGYKTVAGTATSIEDFTPVDSSLTFMDGEREKQIDITIIEDQKYELDETFQLVLHSPTPTTTKLGIASCEITIINVDFPGVFVFEKNHYHVCESQKMIDIVVKRREGRTGRVTCDYKTVDETAIAPSDYTHVEGTLVFEDGETEKTIRIDIIDDDTYEKDEIFRVELSNATNDACFAETTLGGVEMESCAVTIISDEENRKTVDTIMSMMHLNKDRIQLGTGHWIDGFKQALLVNGGDEDEEATLRDKITHIIVLPWKILFAFLPPTDFAKGWAAFVSSLIMIGVVTALIGDLASMLGCVVGMPDAVTAITFVALGTSLPDTFASMTAAIQDADADASLGNVTGSNSVNVFLGLGLPWLIAALYWSSEGPTDAWYAYVNKLDASVIESLKEQGFYQTGGFVVPAGNLSFSVSIYTICALLCIGTLMLRRKYLGAVLGGPKKWRNITAIFFIGLWFFYIIMSSLKDFEYI